MNRSSRLEILCAVFWLFGDILWLFQIAWPCYVAFAAAVMCAGAFRVSQRKEPRAVRLAADTDFFWIVFNLLWAIGDIGGSESVMIAAKVAAVISGAVFVLAVVWADNARQVMLLPLRMIDLFKKGN